MTASGYIRRARQRRPEARIARAISFILAAMVGVWWIYRYLIQMVMR